MTAPIPADPPPADRDVTAPAPVFVGDGALPPARPGSGRVLLTFHFTSQVQLYRDGVQVHDRPNYDVWIPPPVLRIDGQPVRASWSTWCYPLRPGPHEIEVGEPAAARQRVEVAAGTLLRLAYQASITIRKDHTDTRILDWHSTATIG